MHIFKNWKDSENYKLLDWRKLIMENQCLPKGVFMPPLSQYGAQISSLNFLEKGLSKDLKPR